MAQRQYSDNDNDMNLHAKLQHQHTWGGQSPPPGGWGEGVGPRHVARHEPALQLVLRHNVEPVPVLAVPHGDAGELPPTCWQASSLQCPASAPSALSQFHKSAAFVCLWLCSNLLLQYTVICMHPRH